MRLCSKCKFWREEDDFFARSVKICKFCFRLRKSAQIQKREITHKRTEAVFNESRDFDFEKQLIRSTKIQSEYITCYKCVEEKHLRNFNEMQYIGYWNSDHWASVPVCNTCWERIQRKDILDRIFDDYFLKKLKKERASDEILFIRRGFIKNFQVNSIEAKSILQDLMSFEVLQYDLKSQLKKIENGK